MKLRNNKTGEVFNFAIKAETDPTESHFKLRTGSGGWEDGLMYGSLEELNEEWEDYEEPKEFWFIDSGGEVKETTYLTENDKTSLRNFGNYFETKEDAEKAVEKLKAWKHLKDKGIRFKSVNGALGIINFTFDNYCSGEPHSAVDDLELLFGGDE